MELTFTVSFEDAPSKLDFANSIINELEDEKRQGFISRRINGEVLTAHNEVMDKLIGSLNKELLPLDVKVERYHDRHYTDSIYAILKLSGGTAKSFGFCLLPESYRANEFEHSKYITYNGKYTLRYTFLDSPCWSARTNWYDVDEQRYGSYVDSILSIVHDAVKTHYKAVN